MHCFVFGLFCFLTRILLLQCFPGDLLWHSSLRWLLGCGAVVILVGLQLLHAKAHDILHLVQHLEIDVLVVFRSIDLAQDALFTNMLSTLKLKEFGCCSTFADVGSFVTT